MSFDTDIAIIGYGPSGVSAANVLGAAGVKAVAFERFTDIYRRARAVTVNEWTMRYFQSVGLDGPLLVGMDETHSLRTMTLDGRELNKVVFGRGTLGFFQSYSIYQPVMEQALRDGAARFSDHVEVRYGIEAVDVAQDAGGVTITTRDLASGEIARTRARYALACDGGSSATRERLGIPMLGDTIETEWVIIDARVKRWWPNRHVLTFWSDAKRPAVDIALALGTHRWELPLEPHETQADFQTPEQLWRVLEPMGVSRDDVELGQHAFYKHHVRRAERWRAGRVFLVGDAAHMMPPWAGQGMQSGIRDVFNLGWKLTEVLAGRISDDILDTYEPERAPNVEFYTQFSDFTGRIVKQLLDPEEMAALTPPPGEASRGSPLLLPPHIEAGWLNGDPGPGSAVGKMIPQPRAARANGKRALLDRIIGNGFVMLGDNVDPASLLDASQRTAWDLLNTTYRTVRSPDQHARAESDVIDIDGTLLTWMRRYGARAIAVRPDRFVAASDASLSVPTVTTTANRLGPHAQRNKIAEQV